MTAEMATILNIDDQEPGRYARRRMLERAGYDVIRAARKAEGNGQNPTGDQQWTPAYRAAAARSGGCRVSFACRPRFPGGSHCH